MGSFARQPQFGVPHYPIPAPSPAPSRGELPIIQATMDLIWWRVSLIDLLPW